jgi:hypothetical protein
MIAIDGRRWPSGFKGTETAQNGPKSREIGNRAPSARFLGAEDGGSIEPTTLPNSIPAGASTSIVYRLLGQESGRPEAAKNGKSTSPHGATP